MFAIISNGGKQYWVQSGDKLILEKIEAEVGSHVDLKVISSGDDNSIAFGSALKENSIKATVLKHFRDDKVIIFKKKRREHYKRKHGHRQSLSLVKIESI
jgi:large subunit ribosomal protein L21